MARGKAKNAASTFAELTAADCQTMIDGQYTDSLRNWIVEASSGFDGSTLSFQGMLPPSSAIGELVGSSTFVFKILYEPNTDKYHLFLRKNPSV